MQIPWTQPPQNGLSKYKIEYRSLHFIKHSRWFWCRWPTSIALIIKIGNIILSLLISRVFVKLKRGNIWVDEYDVIMMTIIRNTVYMLCPMYTQLLHSLIYLSTHLLTQLLFLKQAWHLQRSHRKDSPVSRWSWEDFQKQIFDLDLKCELELWQMIKN